MEKKVQKWDAEKCFKFQLFWLSKFLSNLKFAWGENYWQRKYNFKKMKIN